MSKLLRVYAPEECGNDGYPRVWHSDVKFWIREQAGHRCERCGHPYMNGEHGRGEWSPCQLGCRHFGPGRHRPTEADLRAAVPEGYPPIVNEDGWVYFDEGDVPWMLRHGETVESKWRILTVHHLIGNKNDLRWWNLAALCQRCHLQIQGKVNMHQMYPFEHSDWFKPHAAGYYALTYLGEDLTRAQTMERLDDLLALELVK